MNMQLESMTRQQAEAKLVSHVLQNWKAYPKVRCIACGSFKFQRQVEAAEMSALDPANTLGTSQTVHRSVLTCKGCGIYILLGGSHRNVEKVDVDKNELDA